MNPWMLLGAILVSGSTAGYFGHSWGVSSTTAKYETAINNELVAERNKTQALQEKLNAAVKDGFEKQRALQTALDSFNKQLSGVHGELAIARAKISTASPEASNRYGEAQDAVLEECFGRYYGVAGKAESIAIDTMKLYEGWPE